MKRLLAIALTAIPLAAACEGRNYARLDSAAPPPGQSSYLAIEHELVIDVPDDAIERAHQAVVEACANDAEKVCAVLQSTLTRGDYASATIRMRIRPAGVEPLIALASGYGEILRRQTAAEDLATPVLDTDKRIAMLEAYLADLVRLRQQSRNEVEALIRVAGEIAKTQSELDNAKAEQAHLAQRIELQILEINFTSDRRDSFLAPIADAFGDFKADLSGGIAQAIRGVAYLLPWLVILVPLAFLLRRLWRRIH